MSLPGVELPIGKLLSKLLGGWGRRSPLSEDAKVPMHKLQVRCDIVSFRRISNFPYVPYKSEAKTSASRSRSTSRSSSRECCPLCVDLCVDLCEEFRCKTRYTPNLKNRDFSITRTRDVSRIQWSRSFLSKRTLSH